MPAHSTAMERCQSPPQTGSTRFGSRLCEKYAEMAMPCASTVKKFPSLKRGKGTTMRDGCSFKDSVLRVRTTGGSSRRQRRNAVDTDQSLCMHPASGAIPFAPDASMPSTANRSGCTGIGMAGVHDILPQCMPRMRPSSKAPMASDTRNGSKLRSSAFESRSVDSGFGMVRLRALCMVCITHPAAALTPAQSGPVAAGLWQNAGSNGAWLARRQFA
jgi:hypothetical protein